MTPQSIPHRPLPYNVILESREKPQTPVKWGTLDTQTPPPRATINAMKTQLPDTVNAGQTLEVQLSPFGTFPANDGSILQHCDQIAFTALLNNFHDEVLVDFEHDAETGGPTTAAAWVQALRVDPEKGLMATFKFTDIGATAVSERRLRFLSPVWTIDENGRPDTLVSVGLTNKPNLPVRPILNRAAAALHNTVEATKPTKENTMKEALLEVLGLPPETEEAALIDAVRAIKQQLDEANEAALNNEAEEAADENQEQIENRAAFIASYKANPVAARALLNTIKKPATTKVKNRFAGATTPHTPAQGAQADIIIANKWKAMPHGDEKDAFLAMNKAAITRGLEHSANK